ncbi:MAG: cupredoxin domain-containing protein [Rhizobiales bacterium]|nr:cupredoxin domain-containing protein [Hyphomicrobiales bacterium]
MTGMSDCSGALNRRHILAVVLLASAVARRARAEDAVSLSLTIKDGKFEPAELHAPGGRALEIHVTNRNAIPSEFESSDLHFEKIVPAGKDAVVRVRPQQPGRYNFFDDFHRETQGVLVVP